MRTQTPAHGLHPAAFGAAFPGSICHSAAPPLRALKYSSSPTTLRSLDDLATHLHQ